MIISENCFLFLSNWKLRPPFDTINALNKNFSILFIIYFLLKTGKSIKLNGGLLKNIISKDF
jgi:hypothetical protein